MKETPKSASDQSPSGWRRLVAELFEPDPRIYWADLLLHSALGWGAFWMSLQPALSWWQWSAVSLVSILALYRAVVFTHELVHVRHARLPGFKTAWNLLCGIPLLVPSFMYDGVHQEHHFRKQYGTTSDGEYLPFGRPPRVRIPLYLLSHVLLPPLAVLRFAVLAPVSLLFPRVRQAVLARASSLSINPAYLRRVPDPVPREWLVQEVACTAWAWCAGVLLWLGWLPMQFVGQLYGVAVGILVLNGVRTLAAHRYLLDGAGAVSFVEQIGDSVNITHGGWLTPMLAPVGLRYHALHHLFPTMPYHNLGAAHRRMMRDLPPEAVYRGCQMPNIGAALYDLWNAAGEAAGDGAKGRAVS